ncbi:unnamed protein product, partial [Mesorhabditis belari]|uniref:Uncharacterized protein n=1 Tax=Mesorhabditis belari TaxID=2138241 RepID=A0AAF3F9E2_9BILA
MLARAHLTALCLLLIVAGVNGGKCLDNYSFYNPESWVCATMGRIFPETRNALIRDRNNGFNFMERHWRQVGVPFFQGYRPR